MQGDSPLCREVWLSLMQAQELQNQGLSLCKADAGVAGVCVHARAPNWLGSHSERAQTFPYVGTQDEVRLFNSRRPGFTQHKLNAWLLK